MRMINYKAVKLPNDDRLYICQVGCSEIGAKVFAYQYGIVSTIKELIGNSVRDVILDEMPNGFESNTLDYRQLYKIIFPVPSEVTCIKEGDEFFENNLINGCVN